jgi:hypothetical protein
VNGRRALALGHAMLHTSPRREERTVYQQRQSRWRPTKREIRWIGGILAILSVAVLIGYRYGITLWDWLQLLIVPAVIAGGGLWFNRRQQKREHELAKERARDEALQAYLDHMSELLLDKNRPLYQAKEGDALQALARARTLTVLGRLEGSRKGTVVRFLYESGLIGSAPIGAGHGKGEQVAQAVVRLSEADLSGADLTNTNLSGADLSGAYLGSYYGGHVYVDPESPPGGLMLRLGPGGVTTNLSRANLSGAMLLYADLTGTDLRGANLSEADLSWANLTGALVTDEQLDSCESLEGATMPRGQKYEDRLGAPGTHTLLRKLEKIRGEDEENGSPS